MENLFATVTSNPTITVGWLAASLLVGVFIYLCGRFLTALAKYIEEGLIKAVTPDTRSPRLLGSRRPPVTASRLNRRRP